MTSQELDQTLSRNGGKLLRSEFDGNDQLTVALVVYPQCLRVYTNLGVSIYDWDAIQALRSAISDQKVT